MWDDAEFRENPGYALAGDVIELGPNVNGFVVGDRVVTLKNHASLVVTSTDPWVTLKIPDGLSYKAATFVVLASVSLHAIHRAQIELGDTVLIFGAGVVGLTLLQLAKMGGAQQVIVLDMVDDRLQLARRYGADFALNPISPDTRDAVLRATRGQGPPIILEATGNSRVVLEALKLAAPGGRIVCLGALEEEISINLHREFIRRELSLIAAFQPFCPTTDNIYWRWTQQENRRLLLELLATGKLRVDEMLTHRFRCDRAPQVYERLAQGDKTMLGVLLVWSRES
jgi:2-desacetyl-2-hydroxyethyl bacteriochlorophyllide A dehydrogenase